MRRLAAVVLLSTVLCGCRATTTPPAAPPNILLVTIDTWRADRLQPSLTPNLSALARSGAMFTNARAAAPLTLPSHTTLLTGLLPPVHGVRENGNVLNETHTTIARLLKDRGYQTAAFVGAFVLDRRFGLARGFDTYDDKIPRNPNATEKLDAERSAAAVIDAALAWFSAPSTQHPFLSGSTSTIPTRLMSSASREPQVTSNATTAKLAMPTHSWRGSLRAFASNRSLQTP